MKERKNERKKEKMKERKKEKFKEFNMYILTEFVALPKEACNCSECTAVNTQFVNNVGRRGLCPSAKHRLSISSDKLMETTKHLIQGSQLLCFY